MIPARRGRVCARCRFAPPLQRWLRRRIKKRRRLFSCLRRRMEIGTVEGEVWSCRQKRRHQGEDDDDIDDDMGEQR